MVINTIYFLHIIFRIHFITDYFPMVFFFSWVYFMQSPVSQPCFGHCLINSHISGLTTTSFWFIFVLFNNNYIQNCILNWDSNSYRRSEPSRWPPPRPINYFLSWSFQPLFSLFCCLVFVPWWLNTLPPILKQMLFANLMAIVVFILHKYAWI